MPDICRLYLDQMLRHEVAQALRDEGHDVLRATEVGQARADDDQILQKAISENRVLVTLDEHFGDWVILPLRFVFGDAHKIITFSINSRFFKRIEDRSGAGPLR